MKPIHVLVATPLGRGGKGGIDRMMDAVADELARSGRSDVRVRFVATRGNGPLVTAPFVFGWFLLRLVVLRLAGRCDLVHVNVAQKGSVYRKAFASRLAAALRLPYLVHLHGSRFDSFWNKGSPAERFRVKAMLEGASLVLVLGAYWRDFLLRAKLVSPDRIVVLPNATAVRRARSHPPAGPVRLLFTGRLGERKGTPQLIEALARLKHRGEWRATLAGDGEVEPARSVVRDAGLIDRIAVPGWLGAADLEQALEAADILVLPSKAENLPMSVIEAMAAGLAIVTTPVGATPDIISDGETGLLVPPDDVDALAAAIGRLLEDPSLRQRLGANAREFHRRHLSMDGYADQLVSLWMAAAKAGVTRAPRSSLE